MNRAPLSSVLVTGDSLAIDFSPVQAGKLTKSSAGCRVPLHRPAEAFIRADGAFSGDFSPVAPGNMVADGPTSNTGQNPPVAGALVDWLTFVLPLPAVTSRFGQVSDRVIHFLLSEVLGPTGISVGAVRDRFFNFYPQSVVLVGPDNTRAGDVGFGGDKGTVCVSLSGHGCRWVRDWRHTRAMLETLGARLTRVDVAYDDVDGDIFEVRQLIELAKVGGFVCGGRPPETGHYDDHGTGKGCTLQVGGKGHKQLCIYEKGKQLGDPDSKWVRAECRLYGKHVGGSVDYEALTDPLAYLKGSYDVMATMLFGAASRMKTVKAAVEATGNALVHWLQTQTGPSLRLLRDALGDGFEAFLEEHIFRHGDPGRFRAAGAHTDLRDLLRVTLFDFPIQRDKPPALASS